MGLGMWEHLTQNAIRMTERHAILCTYLQVQTSPAYVEQIDERQLTAFRGMLGYNVMILRDTTLPYGKRDQHSFVV